MAAELLSEMMNRSRALSDDEKRRLARFLREQATVPSTLTESGVERQRNDAALHLVWLKAHRDEYSGQYVALDGDALVGHGSTRREAAEKAKHAGVALPFLVYVLSFDSIADGGL